LKRIGLLHPAFFHLRKTKPFLSYFSRFQLCNCQGSIEVKRFYFKLAIR